jgi:low affinity Fe/Cu permease
MNESDKGTWFEKFASKATRATGSSSTFLAACVLILGWIVTGPFFQMCGNYLLIPQQPL